MNLNNNKKDIQISFKAQRLALFWLLGLIYSGFIGLQLGRVQAIADFNYSLHEIMYLPFNYLPFNIALFVIPFVFLIYIYLLIKYLLKREK